MCVCVCVCVFYTIQRLKTACHLYDINTIYIYREREREQSHYTPGVAQRVPGS